MLIKCSCEREQRAVLIHSTLCLPNSIAIEQKNSDEHYIIAVSKTVTTVAAVRRVS